MVRRPALSGRWQLSARQQTRVYYQPSAAKCQLHKGPPTHASQRLHGGPSSPVRAGKSTPEPIAVPAVEIEGEHYWDGGLISNTPLQWVVRSDPRRDTLAFQVDLWSSRGDFPSDLAEVTTRQKEIQYSSRTRYVTDTFKRIQQLRAALTSLLEKLPEELRHGPEAAVLRSEARRTVYNIVHLIYRSKHYEGNSKDYEFSRSTMEEHWTAGYHDALKTLRHKEVLRRPTNPEGVFTFDLAEDGRL